MGIESLDRGFEIPIESQVGKEQGEGDVVPEAQSWMPTPDPAFLAPGAPPSLQYLAQVDSLMAQQELSVMQSNANSLKVDHSLSCSLVPSAVIGLSSAQRFQILNGQGQLIFYAVESRSTSYDASSSSMLVPMRVMPASDGAVVPTELLFCIFSIEWIKEVSEMFQLSLIGGMIVGNHSHLRWIQVLCRMLLVCQRGWLCTRSVRWMTNGCSYRLCATDVTSISIYILGKSFGAAISVW